MEVNVGLFPCLPLSSSKWPSTVSITLSAARALGCSSKRATESISHFLLDCQTNPHSTAPWGWWSHWNPRVPTEAPCGTPREWMLIPDSSDYASVFFARRYSTAGRRHLFSSRAEYVFQLSSTVFGSVDMFMHLPASCWPHITLHLACVLAQLPYLKY